MTALQLAYPQPDKGIKTDPNVTPGMFIAAAVLALLIGASAVDIQQRTVITDHQQSWEQQVSNLDGRGKWAGYM